MNAWLLDNQTVKLGTKAIPEPNDYTVLIKNSAIGINPVDWKLIDGRLGNFSKNHIPGVDGVGTIVKVGTKVLNLSIGTRVAYHTDLTKDGSFSEYTLVDARALIPVPNLLNDISAAAFPCPGLTAWQSVQKLPKISGKKILVNGAGGAVGSLITQILVAHGAKVYAVASQKRHKQLAQLGVVQSFDYRDDNWFESLFDNQKFYAVFDMVNGISATKLAQLLEFYGHIISVQDRVEKSPFAPFTTSISLHEIALASQHLYGSDQQWYELVQAGFNLLSQISMNALVLPQIKTVQFSEIKRTLEMLKQNNDGQKYIAYI